MKILGVITAFIIIILIDLPLLLKNSQRLKTVLIYSFIIILGLSISIFQIVFDQVITPSDILESLVKSIIG